MRIGAVADHQRHALAEGEGSRQGGCARLLRNRCLRRQRQRRRRRIARNRGGCIRDQRQPHLCRGLVGLAAGIGSHDGQRRLVIVLRAGIVAVGLVGQRTLDVARDQHAVRRRHDVGGRLVLGEPDRLATVGNRAIEIAPDAPDRGPVDQRLRQRRVEPDGAAASRQSATSRRRMAVSRKRRSACWLPGATRGFTAPPGARRTGASGSSIPSVGRVC